MAVPYRQALIGILCLTLFHQALGACRSCESSKEDKDCKDIYKPKDESKACVMSNNDKTVKTLCKLYDKGWKIVCKWAESSTTCQAKCPRNSAGLLTYDVILAVVLTSVVLSIQRLLH